MKKNEAISAIESIQSLIKSSNKAFVSPRQMMVIGVAILMVPILELMISQISLDSHLYGTFGPWANSLPRMLFYGFGFYYLGKKVSEPESKPINPLIAKAFSIERSFLFSCFSVAIALIAIDKGVLIYPFIFILMGLYYNLLGKFINKSFILASWFYLVLGPFYIYLTKFGLSHLWMWFLVLHGLSYIFIAFYSNKYDRENR